MPNKVNQYVDIPIDQDSFAPPSAKSHLAQYKEQVQQVPPLPSFCDQVIDTIPDSLYGRDRMVHIAQVLEKISKSQITELQVIIEYFMRYMLVKGASDLDMGGPACNNCIWLRVDGNKRKHIELGYYTPRSNQCFITKPAYGEPANRSSRHLRPGHFKANKSRKRWRCMAPVQNKYVLRQ